MTMEPLFLMKLGNNGVSLQRFLSDVHPIIDVQMDLVSLLAGVEEYMQSLEKKRVGTIEKKEEGSHEIQILITDGTKVAVEIDFNEMVMVIVEDSPKKTRKMVLGELLSQFNELIDAILFF